MTTELSEQVFIVTWENPNGVTIPASIIPIFCCKTDEGANNVIIRLADMGLKVLKSHYPLLP